MCVCGDEELPSAGRRQGVVPGGWWVGGGLGPDFVWFTRYKLIMEIEEVKAEEAEWLKIQLFCLTFLLQFLSNFHRNHEQGFKTTLGTLITFFSF